MRIDFFGPVQHHFIGGFTATVTFMVRRLLEGFTEQMRATDQFQCGGSAGILDSNPNRDKATIRGGTLNIGMPWMFIPGVSNQDVRAPKYNILIKQLSEQG